MKNLGLVILMGLFFILVMLILLPVNSNSTPTTPTTSVITKPEQKEENTEQHIIEKQPIIQPPCCDLYNTPPFYMEMYDGPFLFSGVVEDPFGGQHRYAPPYVW